MTLALHEIVLAPPGENWLFAPLTLEVAPGQIVSVMGPSGLGKSTLIDFVGGHLAPGFRHRGQVTLSGQDLLGIPAEARRVGVLFQDAALFPHLSVAGNLAFGLSPEVMGRSARRAAISEALQRAGLAGFEARDPATLSGGQRARVALMRTLLAQPRVLLLDEPFSRLDAALRDDLRGFVFDHVRAQGIPVLMVTHDPGDAQAAGGRMIALEPFA
jgi:putative thiamine transport system ATP-binding protein